MCALQSANISQIRSVDFPQLRKSYHNGLSLHTRNDLISGHVGLNYLVNLQAQPVLATIRAFGDWGPHARSLTLWEEFNPCCRHMVYEHDNGESYDWTKWLNPPDPPEEDPVLPPRPLASYLGGHTDPIGLDGLISWYLSKGTLYAILPLLQAVEPRLQQLMILHLDHHSQIFFQLEDLDQPVPWALEVQSRSPFLWPPHVRDGRSRLHGAA